MGFALGVLVALAVTAEAVSSSAPPNGAPLGPPPFSVEVNTTSVYSAPGDYVYNVSILLIQGGIGSTAWTQFLAINSSAYLKIGLLADLVTSSGQDVAAFNSSNSSFDGGFNASTFPGLGGWGRGYGSPIVAGDTFVVRIGIPISFAEVSFWMASANAPHAFQGLNLQPANP